MYVVVLWTLGWISATYGVDPTGGGSASSGLQVSLGLRGPACIEILMGSWYGEVVWVRLVGRLERWSTFRTLHWGLAGPWA